MLFLSIILFYLFSPPSFFHNHGSLYLFVFLHTLSLSLLHILFLYHTLSSSPIPIHSTPYFLTFTHLFHKSLQHNSFLSLSSLNSNSIITQTAKLFLAFTHTYLRTLSLSRFPTVTFSLYLYLVISHCFSNTKTLTHTIASIPSFFSFAGLKPLRRESLSCFVKSDGRRY